MTESTSSWYMPRSFYFIFSFLLIIFTCITRFGYRAIRMMARRRRDKKIGANVMVVGAGEAGNMLIKESRSIGASKTHSFPLLPR